MYNKKYVLLNSESVQCNFLTWNKRNVTFKICCCVQHFIKIEWFVTEIWRYNDLQNGGRPPSWNCFTTIRDHPRSLCCWPQLPVKFHANPTHRSKDVAIWIFEYFIHSFIHLFIHSFIHSFIQTLNKWLEMPIQAPKMGFWETLDP